MQKIYEKGQLDTVLNECGVYIWLDSNQEIIYIGKAIKLKKRMHQYFQGHINSFKTESMVNKIHYFSVIYTRNEREALKLEQELIKKYRPHYNILLLDDRKYPYLNISYSDKSLIFRKVYNTKENGFNFGPFIPPWGLKQLVDNLSSRFMYQNGIKVKIKDLEYWEEKYQQVVAKLKNINLFKKELEQNIQKYSQDLNFEEANEENKLLETLNSFSEMETIEIGKSNDIDIITFEKHQDILYIQTLYYRSGIQLSSNFILGKTALELVEAIKQYLNDNYYNSNTQVVLDYELNTYFNDKNYTFPQKGELKNVLQLCKLNLKRNIDSLLLQQESTKKILCSLSVKLGITINNFIILDISHTAQKEKIGAINTYINGILQNNLNRYYKLNEQSNSDFHLMLELGKIISQQEILEKWDIDTIFVDGSKAQIRAIKENINNKINVIGIAKNERHIAQYLIYNNKIIFIEEQNVFNYIKNIQYKVDKLAKIKMNKTKVRNYFIDSLINIPGIGESTINKLMASFSTYEAIKLATISQLNECVGKRLAKKIYEYFK